MRYRDAQHIDVGSFYARRPEIGRLFRLLGLLGVLCAVLLPPTTLGWLLGGLILVWLGAWYLVVGTLWRSSVVAALLVAALRLSHVLLGCATECAV